MGLDRGGHWTGTRPVAFSSSDLEISTTRISNYNLEFYSSYILQPKIYRTNTSISKKQKLLLRKNYGVEKHNSKKFWSRKNMRTYPKPGGPYDFVMGWLLAGSLIVLGVVTLLRAIS